MPSLPQPPTQPLEPEPQRREQLDSPPWSVWMAPAGVVLGLAAGTLGSLIVELAGQSGGSSVSHPSPAVSIIADIVFDIGFVLAALYLTSMRGRARPADFGFRRVRLLTAVKVMVLAVIVYYGVTTIYAAVFNLRGSDKLPSDLGVTHSTAALVAAAIFVCVIAPIAEEFFFRGFFFGALRKLKIELAGRDVGTWLAAVVTGLLFGLAHTGSASSQYLIPLGFLGFVLCIVRWKTGSLYPCIALHSANNALALGVNQLSWSGLEILGLLLASWAVVGALTLPLGVRSPRVV